MDTVLSGLKAAGEPTRLRLLALCARAELTVSELTQILGQSQPRVSRHLKLLCESGLLDRFREGTWAFYRLSGTGESSGLARILADLVPEDDPVLVRDLERLEAIKQARAAAAAEYFRANAGHWSEIRSLYVPEAEVEAALIELLPEGEIGDFLDVGTGTGRLLEIFAPRVERGTGIDLSHDMLAVARANLEKSDFRHCQVRHGDMYNLSFASATMDVVTIHQVLHFADDPAAAIAEAARVLRPDGTLIVADFAPHDLEFLRTEHAHRRLGFGEEEVAGWCRAAALKVTEAVHLAGDPLTVSLWRAKRLPARTARKAAA